MPAQTTLTAPSPQPAPAKQPPSHADYLAALAAYENDDVFVRLMVDIHTDPNTRH